MSRLCTTVIGRREPGSKDETEHEKQDLLGRPQREYAGVFQRLLRVQPSSSVRVEMPITKELFRFEDGDGEEIRVVETESGESLLIEAP